MTGSDKENVPGKPARVKSKTRKRRGPGSRVRSATHRQVCRIHYSKRNANTQSAADGMPYATQPSDTSQQTCQIAFDESSAPTEVDSGDEGLPNLEFASAQDQEALFYELGLDEDLVSVSAEDWPSLQDVDGNPTITFYGALRSSAHSVSSLNPEENGTFGKEHLESSRTAIHIILSWNMVLE
jgi:hypothetical protein